MMSIFYNLSYKFNPFSIYVLATDLALYAACSDYINKDSSCKINEC